MPFPFAAEDLSALLAVPGAAESGHVLTDDIGAVSGFGQYWVAQHGAVHLGRLVVAPAARGRGLGRELCTQLITAALQATGARVVTLRAYRDNVAAVKLYESLGFREEPVGSSAAVLFMKMPAASPAP
jgi:ribosomal-protein-alanine N-acetyltransferase